MAEPKASTADPRRATAAAWLRSLAERARPGSELEHEGARDRAAETEGAEMALRRGLLQSKSAGRWSRISRELEGRRPEWAQRAKQLALDLRLAWAGRLDGEVEDVFVRQLDLLDELNDEDDRTASVLELREELDAMARQGLAGDLPDLARKRAADIGEDEQVRNHQRREEN